MPSLCPLGSPPKLERAVEKELRNKTENVKDENKAHTYPNEYLTSYRVIRTRRIHIRSDLTLKPKNQVVSLNTFML
jgi:hypothetical protein